MEEFPPDKMHSCSIISTMYIMYSMKELLAKRHRLYTEKFLLVVLTLILVLIIRYLPISEDYFSTRIIKNEIMLTFYQPVFMLRVLQSFDKYTFIHMIPYTIVVMFVLLPIRMIVYSLCMAISVGNKWSIDRYIIFVCTLSLTQPDYILVYFKEKHWMLKVILCWEMVFQIPITTSMYDLTVNHQYGYVTEWYHFVNYMTRKMLPGCFLGGLMGLLSSYVAKRVIDDPICYIFLLYGASYCTFYVARLLALTSYLAYAILAMMLLQHKENLTDEGNAIVKTTVSFVYYILTIFIFAVAVHDINLDLVKNAEGTAYINEAILAYCGLMVSRIAAYGAVYPMLRWYWPGFGFLRVLLLGFSGLNGVHTLIFAMLIGRLEESKLLGHHLLSCVTLVNMLTHIFNGLGISLLLGPWSSASKRIVNQLNVKICVAFINDQKERFVGLWKCKQGMSDTRWDILNKYTMMKTTMFSDMTADRCRRGICSNCKKVVYATMNDKDKVDMKLEVRRLLLTELRSLVIRKQNVGYVTRVCSRVVLKIVQMMYDENDLSLRYKEIESFFNRNTVTEKLLKLYHRIFILRVDGIIKPRRPFRKLCFKIVFSRPYMYFIMLVKGLSLIQLLAFRLGESNSPELISILTIHIVFSLIILVEFVITIEAYSFIYFKDGIKAYFSRGWHRFDFCIVIIILAEICFNLVIDILKLRPYEELYIFNYLICLRFIRIFVFYSHISPPLLHLFEELQTARRGLGLEIVKILISCFDDLLLYMHKVIHVGYEMDMEVREKLEKERTWLLNLIVRIYKEQPTLVKQVSTKMALISITFAIHISLKEFKVFGYIDNIEYTRLERKVEQLESRAIKLSYKIIEQNEEVFYTVPWLPKDKKVVQYLRDHSVIMDFEENWTLATPNRHLYGLYIIINGMLKVEYEPTLQSVDPLYTLGQIPVVGFLESVKFDRQFLQVITSGCTVGEICFLTGRPYSGMITTITKVKAFFINRHTLVDAIEMDTDTCEGIPQKMWKSVCMFVGVAIIFQSPVFQIMTRLQAKKKLNRGHVPNLQDYTVFCTNHLIEDVFLIDGKVASFYDRRTFIAPCCLPRTVSKLFVPVTNMELPACVLLVIPFIGVTLDDLREEIEKTNSNLIENMSKVPLRMFRISRQFTKKPSEEEELELRGNIPFSFDWINIMRSNR